jgi:hypothetical protein
MSKKIFGTHSRKISKHYNGRALCPDLLEALFDQHAPSEGKNIHAVYKMIDKTNDWEYVGMFKATSFYKFATYTGSGTLLRSMIDVKGIQNFEFHFIAFFDNKKDAETLEATLVNENYLRTAKTYNLILGGDNKKTFMHRNAWLHDPKTQRTFSVHEGRVEMLKSELGFVEGYSKDAIEAMKRTPSNIAKNRKMKTFKLTKDMMGDQVFIDAPWDKVHAYLNLGWQFVASRVWMHKPSATHTYVRGENWSQPASHDTDRIMDKLNDGWVMGRPPKYEVPLTTQRGNRKKRGKRVNGKYIEKNIIQNDLTA